MANHAKAVEEIPLLGPIVSADLPPRVPDWVEKLAWLMDRSIPISKRGSIGLDGVVGLFPGVGDLVDTVQGGIPFIGVSLTSPTKRTPRTSRSIESLGTPQTESLREFLNDSTATNA